MCPWRSDPFYIVTYYIKWVTTSWTYSNTPITSYTSLLVSGKHLIDWKPHTRQFIISFLRLRSIVAHSVSTRTGRRTTACAGSAAKSWGPVNPSTCTPPSPTPARKSSRVCCSTLPLRFVKHFPGCYYFFSLSKAIEW